MTIWKGAALFCAVALLAFGGLATYRHTAAPPTQAPSVSGEVARLEQELAALRSERGASASQLSALSAEVRALKQQQQALLVASGAAPAASAPSSQQAQQLSPSDFNERARLARQKNTDEANRVGDKLDGALRGEAIDRDWSAKTTDTIKAVFAAIPNSRIEQADCRARLCRVVVRHDDADEQLSFGHKVLTGPPFDREVLFRYDWDSKPPRTVLYVAREGSHLQSLADSTK